MSVVSIDTVEELEELFKDVEKVLDKGLKLEVYSFINDFRKTNQKFIEIEKEFSDLKDGIKTDLKNLSDGRNMRTKVDHTENLIRILTESLNLEKQRISNAKERLKTVVPLLERIKQSNETNGNVGAGYSPAQDIKNLEKHLKTMSNK